MADLQDHRDAPMGPREITLPGVSNPLFLSRYINGNQSSGFGRERLEALGALQPRVQIQGPIQETEGLRLLTARPPGDRGVAPVLRVARVQPEGRVERGGGFLGPSGGQEEFPLPVVGDVADLRVSPERRLACDESVLRAAEALQPVGPEQRGCRAEVLRVAEGLQGVLRAAQGRQGLPVIAPKATIVRQATGPLQKRQGAPGLPSGEPHPTCSMPPAGIVREPPTGLLRGPEGVGDAARPEQGVGQGGMGLRVLR